jgi:hypothetical protein
MEIDETAGTTEKMTFHEASCRRDNFPADLWSSFGSRAAQIIFRLEADEQGGRNAKIAFEMQGGVSGKRRHGGGLSRTSNIERPTLK